MTDFPHLTINPSLVIFIIISEIRCSVLLPPPSHGSIRCTNSTNIGSECTYYCADDYRLTGGTTKRMCEINGESGSWNGAAPSCTCK